MRVTICFGKTMKLPFHRRDIDNVLLPRIVSLHPRGQFITENKRCDRIAQLQLNHFGGGNVTQTQTPAISFAQIKVYYTAR